MVETGGFVGRQPEAAAEVRKQGGGRAAGHGCGWLSRWCLLTVVQLHHVLHSHIGEVRGRRAGTCRQRAAQGRLAAGQCSGERYAAAYGL